MSLMEYFLKSVSLGVEVQSRQRKKPLREKEQCWESGYNTFRFAMIPYVSLPMWT